MAAKKEPPAAPAADTRARKTRIAAAKLLRAVKDVTGVVEGRNTIPILSCLRFEARDGIVHLAATNLDCWVERDVATDDRDGPGSAEWIKGIRPFAVTLPAKALQDLLGELDPDAMVTISAPDEADPQWRGAVTISAGRARFRLNCLPVEDFPEVPFVTDEASFEIEVGTLADCFARVEHAVSSDETRYYLNGIFSQFWQATGGAPELRWVTTDGHRLAMLSLDPPEGAHSWPDAIVPRPVVGVLDRLLAEAVKAAAKQKDSPQPVIYVAIGGSAPGSMMRCEFELPEDDKGGGGSVALVTKTIDGTFPDYTRVIPSDPQLCLTVARSNLASAIKRVSALVSDKTRAVKMELEEDRLTLSVTTVELGEAREEVPCSWAGPALVAGFNGAYWRQALAALASDDVLMEFTSADSVGPVRIRAGGDGPDRLVQVLMPMTV